MGSNPGYLLKCFYFKLNQFDFLVAKFNLTTSVLLGVEQTAAEFMKDSERIPKSTGFSDQTL